MQQGAGAPGDAETRERMQALRAGMKGSLSRTFAVLGSVFTLLPLLIVFILVASAGRQQVTEQVQAQLESVAALQRWQIDQWLHNREITLRLLGTQPDIQENAHLVFD